MSFDLNFKNERGFQAEGIPWGGWARKVWRRCSWLEEVRSETYLALRMVLMLVRTVTIRRGCPDSNSNGFVSSLGLKKLVVWLGR